MGKLVGRSRIGIRGLISLDKVGEILEAWPGGLGDPSRKQERAEPINQEGCCKGDAGLGASGYHRASQGGQR